MVDLCVVWDFWDLVPPLESIIEWEGWGLVDKISIFFIPAIYTTKFRNVNDIINIKYL